MSDSENNPCDDLIELIARAERLESFPRTGWQVCGVQHPESVASHSYVVTLIALWLADRLDKPLDTEQVLRIALVHDLPEAMLTDLPRPVKQLLGDDAVADAEDAAADALFVPNLPNWRAAHAAYRQAASLEARIVKAADRIQMLAKALQYRAEHRGRTDRFFDDRSAYDDYGIELVSSILDRLFEWYRQDRWPPPGYE